MQIGPICCELLQGEEGACHFLFCAEFSSLCAKAGAGCSCCPSHEAGHVSRRTGGLRDALGSFSGSVASELDFSGAVYVNLSVLLPLQDTSAAVAAGSGMLERGSMLGCLNVIFVNLLLKMPLVLFQIAFFTTAHLRIKGLGIYFITIILSVHECVNYRGQSISAAPECCLQSAKSCHVPPQTDASAEPTERWLIGQGDC